MEHFTPVSALFGGLLIGLGAVTLMLFLGRIAGIAGIVGGLLAFDREQWRWRLAFIAGLVAAPLVLGLTNVQLPAVSIDAPPFMVIAAGLLVGFGTRLGNGCTSGHGVCGLARLSARSLVATAVFMGVAALVVFLTRHAWGG
ncbi:MAG: YeeE/YedE family protein [Hyphomicrobiales bacterium]|nr:YeeE/YedE family protein [Hyphomicrobiales bacterium]